MAGRARRLARVALSALYYTRAHKMLASWTGGVGLIFALHHVRPEEPGVIEPNRTMRITPQFLEAVIRLVRDTGLDIISLDEMHVRLVEGDFRRRFAVFTFDDGYKDNLEFAYPIFRRHNLPFAVYVPTDYADGRGELWWVMLEKIIGQVDGLTLRMDGVPRKFGCATANEKWDTYRTIYRWLRGLPEGDARQTVRELCRAIGYNPSNLCAEVILGWDELRSLARDPLVTIGAHSRSHRGLSRLSLAQAESEISGSVARIEHEIGARCEHFSYPFGCAESCGEREFALARELGLKTAVTLQPGVIEAGHGARLTALPRLTLDGDMQDVRCVRVMLEGVTAAVEKRMPGLAGGRAAA